MAEGPIVAEDPRAQDPAQIGGKGLNLARLSVGGFEVPPWFAVGTDAFDAVVSRPELRAALDEALGRHDLSDPKGAEAASAEVAALLADADAEHLVALVRAGLEGLALPEDAFLAVRSSAVGEDSEGSSFAGQMDTFLYVRGLDDVVGCVRKCWASAFSARALHYRAQRGEDPRAITTAVVVQQMIPGEVSGVLFTACPTSGRRDLAVVSAVWGLGEGLVSGELAADTFSATKAEGTIEDRDVQPKERQVVFHEAQGGGTHTIDVPAERREAPCLSDPEVKELALLGARIEGYYRTQRLGLHQDVEWTRHEGTWYVLQARPITQLPPPPPAGLPRLWDNSNIIESYSGVTSPMTFSYIRYGYARAYQQSCEISGIEPAEVRAHEQTFHSMLGLLRGCVYYNLASWYTLLSLFPGFEKNQERMEQMMGVRESSKIVAAAPKRTLWQKLRMGYCMIRNYLKVAGWVDTFQSNFWEHYPRYDELDWDAQTLDDLHRIYHELIRTFLHHWEAPLVTDFCAMLFNGKLKELTVRYGIDPDGGLQNDLLCGEGGIESTEPTRWLIRLAQTARGDAQLRALLEETAPEACLEALASSTHTAFHEEIQAYLKKYGFRCMNELKLEEPTLRDDPSFLFSMLKNYLKQDDLNVEDMERREREKRAAAEAMVRRKLRFRPLRKRNFWKVLRETRLHVKNRENMRFARTRCYGLFRQLLNRAGQILFERGELADPHDVYYLQLDELLGYVDGTATCTDLKGLSLLRKAEFTRYREGDEPDDRFKTLGAVHAGNTFEGERPEIEGDGSTLKGTPCCPGKVEGKVRVIRSASDDLSLNGEILVAARTDPGWVPLYPSASGLLIERGSLLSHSAIVARELGLPTIVNIPGLMANLQDGDTVSMDAGAGIARKVEVEASAETPAEAPAEAPSGAAAE